MTPLRFDVGSSATRRRHLLLGGLAALSLAPLAAQPDGLPVPKKKLIG